MIQYKLCHRGAFEYDKIVLNVLQFYNAVVRLEDRAIKAGAEAAGRLRALEKTAQQYVEVHQGEHSPAEKLYAIRIAHL